MLHKLGLNTFYGQSFLADICEMDHEMLPYTATYFEELIRTGKIAKIEPNISLAPPETSHELIFFETLSIANVLKALMSKFFKES